MPYCKECGVEVDELVDHCPLCQAPIRVGTKHMPRAHAKYPDKPLLSDKTERTRVLKFIIWEIISVTLATGLLIVFLTNLIVDFAVTWSAYPMAALLLIWLLATIPLFLYKKPLWIPLLSAAAMLSFLAFLDVVADSTIDWFHLIAVPIAVLLIIVITLVILVSLKVKKKGFNIAAFILFGCGLVAAGVDAIINYFLLARVTLTWSLFVIIPVFFTGIFMLYIHYRLAKAVDLRKWFQI